MNALLDTPARPAPYQNRFEFSVELPPKSLSGRVIFSALCLLSEFALIAWLCFDCLRLLPH
jgi:hypothetical protein